MRPVRLSTPMGGANVVRTTFKYMNKAAPGAPMHPQDSEARSVRELLDRQAILDCIHRYCRGVDRFDRDMVLSVYHPDAIDHHGAFVGGPEAFVDWAFNYHTENQQAHHHMVMNHSCEL